MQRIFIFIFLAICSIFIATYHTTLVEARVTPDDIYNEAKATHDQRLSTYTPATQQKIKTLEQALADTNKKQTDQLELIMERQGQILDEYMRREGRTYRVADGINRNLTDPVENANYWITYAHEAVAYQASQKYMPTLGSEANWKGNMLNEVANLQSDINVLKGKVEKSRQLVEGVVSK